MRSDRLVRLALASALALAVGQAFFGAGVASAQAPAEPAPADPGGAPANPGLARQVSLSPQEMLAQADSALARMEAGRTSVAKQLAQARKDRDVVKTLCLNDKLNQLDVASRSAQERRGALELAVKRGDNDLANHEFTILGVLRQRSEQLMSEANQCIGEEAGFAGDSATSMTVTGVPDDSADVPDFTVVLEPPQCSSCFQ